MACVGLAWEHGTSQTGTARSDVRSHRARRSRASRHVAAHFESDRRASDVPARTDRRNCESDLRAFGRSVGARSKPRNRRLANGNKTVSGGCRRIWSSSVAAVVRRRRRCRWRPITCHARTSADSPCADSPARCAGRRDRRWVCLVSLACSLARGESTERHTNRKLRTDNLGVLVGLRGGG